MTDDGAQFPIALPLNDGSRARIITALQALPERVRGTDVPLLVEYIEEALYAVSASNRMLALTPTDVATLESEKTIIRQHLVPLAESARLALAALPPPRGTPEHAAAAENRPILKRYDPLALELASLTRLREGPLPTARAVRQALAVLARLRAPAGPRSGRKYDAGVGSALVRAVALYVSEQPGLRLSLWWREADLSKTRTGRRGGVHPRRGQSLPATTDHLELLVRAAEVFGLEVDNSKLRTHVNNYREQLSAMGRDAPDAIDLYGPPMEEKPRRTKVIKRKKVGN